MGKMIDCVYWGLFVNQEIGYSLEVPVEDMHVTFGFGVPMPAELLGKKGAVTVIGAGCDDRNEALRVSLPPMYWEVYKGADVPHVTLSTSKDGKPVDSANLDFEQWDPVNWYDLPGRFGYFDGEQVRFGTVEDERDFHEFQHKAYRELWLQQKSSVAYLCNGYKPECRHHSGCFTGCALHDDPMGSCRYTTDIRYARNFVPVVKDGSAWRYMEKEPQPPYSYEFHYLGEDYELVKEIANSFHNTLCGNEDYRDDRIVLNWSGNEITLTVFCDSETNLWVETAQRRIPKLVVTGRDK